LWNDLPAEPPRYRYRRDSSQQQSSTPYPMDPSDLFASSLRSERPSTDVPRELLALRRAAGFRDNTPFGNIPLQSGLESFDDEAVDDRYDDLLWEMRVAAMRDTSEYIPHTVSRPRLVQAEAAHGRTLSYKEKSRSQLTPSKVRHVQTSARIEPPRIRQSHTRSNEGTRSKGGPVAFRAAPRVYAARPVISTDSSGGTYSCSISNSHAL